MAQHRVDFVLQPELGRWVGEATEWVLGSAVKHLLSVAVTRHHFGSDFSALEILKSEARSLECRGEAWDWQMAALIMGFRARL